MEIFFRHMVQAVITWDSLMMTTGLTNQTADTPNKLLVKGQSYVGDENLWYKYFRKIRATNYFLQNVPKRF